MSKKFKVDVEVPNLKVTGGTPGIGKVFTSDADGDGTWADLPPTISRNITQNSHGFSNFDLVRLNGTSYVKAQADTAEKAEVVGMVTESTANTFKLVMQGYVSGLSSLTADEVYFLSASSAGAYTNTEPSSSGQISKPVFLADTTTSGYVLSHRGMVIPEGAESVLLQVSQILYPVGSVYTNMTNSTNPATLLGFGTWTAITNRVIVGKGSGTFATAGSTGGAETHTLSLGELPSHTHTLPEGRDGALANPGNFIKAGWANSGAGATAPAVQTGSVGSGQAHNNLQPYIVGYMWQRTA